MLRGREESCAAAILRPPHEYTRHAATGPWRTHSAHATRRCIRSLLSLPFPWLLLLLSLLSLLPPAAAAPAAPGDRSPHPWPTHCPHPLPLHPRCRRPAWPLLQHHAPPPPVSGPSPKILSSPWLGGQSPSQSFANFRVHSLAAHPAPQPTQQRRVRTKKPRLLAANITRTKKNAPSAIAPASSDFHLSAIPVSNGSSGLGALNNACQPPPRASAAATAAPPANGRSDSAAEGAVLTWMLSSTVRICSAGLHLSFKISRQMRPAPAANAAGVRAMPAAGAAAGAAGGAHQVCPRLDGRCS